MAILQNMSIKHKLMSIIMSICAGSLLLASVIHLLFQQREYRKEVIKSISCYAEMIGDNCIAALAFKDVKDAEETLKSLRAEPSIVFACVYTEDDKVLAHYQNADITDEFSPPVCKKEGHEFDKDYFKLFKHIKDNDEIIGTAYIQLDLHKMKITLWLKAGTIALIVLMCSLIAYLVSSRLQGIISKPILSLTEVAKRVSDKKDYSTRALKQSNDEVGQLIDSFNEMLEQIQQRDMQLVEINEDLEIRVKERTAELTTANEQLTKQIAERKQAEAKLRQTAEEWITTFDSIADMVSIHDKDFKIVKANKSFAKAFKMELSEIIGKTCCELIHKTKEPPLFCPHIRTLGTEKPNCKEFFEPCLGIYVEASTSPLFDEDGQIMASVHIAKDITERKQAEAELKAAQEKLIEIARKVGMAEVAADVLHNVGNVLNSINVSTTVIREKIASSELANLEKVASIINEHNDDLGTFLTEDPQGKHIPIYLTEVSKYLTDEQTDIIDKLKVLAENVQHIKDIINMQQSYAKVSGVEVQTSLSKLAEDAIQINSAGLERHGTRLIREFEELGDVEIDKQKLLQILVNLISNAKYALSGSNKEEKLVIIRIYKHSEARFRIEVADNGVGVSKDNLAKIFSHGFTTKKDGHGFGLHSSALASKEMGGSLTVHSDGVGQGATFTLELPFKPTEVMK